MIDSRADVIVVGGGPAGSVTAAILADAGVNVLVLEKDAFPRFHIGESLLPACLPVLERLGLGADPDFYLYKRGAEFIRESTGEAECFNFIEAPEGGARNAWHVTRDGFDRQLADRARAAGATFRYGDKVVGVDFDDAGVTVRTRDAALRARYLVDASGQNRLLARKFGSAHPITHFGKTAAFVHFDGVGDEAWAEIGPGHDIRIMVVDDGWGWIIPLARRRLSVGLVTRSEEPATAIVERFLEGSPVIGRWTRGCSRSEVRAERNYSFKNLRPAGSRYACVGDSACFLDPVFSSGVSLAMLGATSVADRLVEALAAGTEAEDALMAPHLEFMETGYRTFSSMIDRFYNTHFIEHFIFGPHGQGKTKQEIVGILAGDVWNPDNRFARMLANSRRRDGVESASRALDNREETASRAD